MGSEGEKTRTRPKIPAQAEFSELRYTRTQRRKSFVRCERLRILHHRTITWVESDSAVDALASLKQLSRDAELRELPLDTEKDRLKLHASTRSRHGNQDQDTVSATYATNAVTAHEVGR